MKILLLLIGWACLFTAAQGQDKAFPKADPPPTFIQDPKTKIIVFLESDQCHIGAISPDGKLLWCRNMFPHANGNRPHIDDFSVGNGAVGIGSTGGGNGSMGASLDEKTGEILSISAV